jgi:prepilin-type N-terminal cleavage/methylation domain-containing protein
LKIADNRKGFTLIEMLMVIFLITLILGISAVLFSNSLPSQKAEAAAREIMAVFRQARSTAISAGRWQSVFVDIDKRQFGIEESGRKRDVPEGIAIRIIDPVKGNITEGGYRFVFSPAGVAEGGTVILSAGKKTIALDIDPIVGAVYSRVQ